jgi:enoyl-CoA hydratase/carnithine racemase
MDYEQITYEVDDMVATVTLNRPDKLNAWTARMGDEIRDALTQAGRDEAVRAIVITGAGRGFCAGADMAVLDKVSTGVREKGADWAANASAGRQTNDRKEAKFRYMIEVPKPIIGAINGPTAGIGFVLPLYCDIRLASDSAFFLTAFAQRGVPAEHGSAWLLPRLIGPGPAMDIMFSSRRVHADEALRFGLVSQVFPEATFHAQVRDYARTLAQRSSPLSLRKMKHEIWAGLEQTFDQAIDLFEHDLVDCFASDDFREGVAHFVEKRAPAFTGR